MAGVANITQIHFTFQSIFPGTQMKLDPLGSEVTFNAAIAPR